MQQKESMEVDIDVYFWLVDRGVYDDDQRNKVDMERNKVKLHREHSQRLENGYYIAKLMNILKKSIMKISKKPFSLDPGLGNMKDNITSTSKQMNWNIICKELKKFGIRVDSEKKVKIIEGRTSLISDILARLFDFDNSGGQSRFIGDGIASEMNYGNNGSIERERDHSGNHNDSTNISLDGKDSLLVGLQSAQKRKDGKLEPLSPAPNSKLQQQQRSKLPASISGASPQLRSNSKPKNPGANTQSVTSLNDLNEGKDLADAETTLEFILLSLSQDLSVKPKQAAGLLSNNHKYLIHIAVKGMKGGDYSKMIQWYQHIYGYAKQLVTLIDLEKEHNAMKLSLNILKCGLYSQNTDLVATCARVLSKVAQEINQIGGQLAGLAWDWFIDASNSQQALNPALQSSTHNSASHLDLTDSPSLANLPAILNDSGLGSCLYSMKKFPSEVTSSIAPVVMQYAKNNYADFFGYQLRKHFLGEVQRKEYIQIVHDLFVAVSASSNMINDAFIASGALDELLTLSIQMADFDPQGHNSSQERIAALSFLADVWEAKSDRIEENQEVAQAILTVMKRGCRDRQRLLRTVSFELMFKLLHHFSVNRNQFAPIIYKSLTFLLIEFHQHVEIREHLMKHFQTLFNQVQTIPVAILCEPLLKQIAIAQLPDSFNIFDFEFFGVVANHKRATVAIATQIIDTMVAQAVQQVFYANSATSIVLELVHRFSREQPLHQHMSRVTADLVSLLEESEKWKKANHNPNQQSLEASTLKKNRTQRTNPLDALANEAQTVALARKMKERLIVNFLKQLILFGVDMIKEDLRTQILRGYARLNEQAKVRQPKSLHYLLQLYTQDGGEVPQMLQYFVEQEKMRSRKRQGGMQILPPNSTDQLDDFLLDTTNNQQLMLAALGGGLDDSMMQPRRLTKAQLHLEKAMKDIEKIRENKAEKREQRFLEEELKRLKDEQMKTVAKKQVEKIQVEHGVMPLASKKPLGGANLGTIGRAGSLDRGAGGSTILPNLNNQSVVLDRNGEPLDVRIVKAKDIDQLSEINANEERRISLLPMNQDDHRGGNKATLKGSQILKELKEFQLFDLRLEEQKDQDAVRFFVKKHLKILRNLFNKYANTTGSNVAGVHMTFEDHQKHNQFINVAEMMKLLKDFQVSSLQVPQKTVMQMFRAINKEILKKKANEKDSTVLMTQLDFEGFVEFLMQLAYLLYHYDSALPPSEYLHRLFEHFRASALKSGSNILKLFQATTNEDGLLVSGVMDNKMVAELNRRLAYDPNTKLPDGYQKVTEREMVTSYTIPHYFPIPESKRVAIEILDEIFAKAFGTHILEPMSELKETLKARPNLKVVTRDKILSEVTTAPSKNVLQALHQKGGSTVRMPRGSLAKRDQANKSSNSVDANPLSSRANLLLTKDMTRGDLLSGKQPLATPQPQSTKPLPPPPPRLPLGVTLKLEVAQTKMDRREQALEAAYALEELLQAVEKGETRLERLGKRRQKPPPPNKLVGDRIKKQEQENKAKVDERKKLEVRKKLLKEQLDQLKVEKAKKDKEKAGKEEESKKKEEDKRKKKHDKLLEDMTRLKEEFAQKREQKQQQEAEKKALEPVQPDPVQRKAEVKEKLKERKDALLQKLANDVEARKVAKDQEEAEKEKKAQQEKQKSQQIKQMYAETKVKAKELKDKYKEEYHAFKELPLVTQMFSFYEQSLKGLYDKYAKLDRNADGLLTYAEYMRIGKELRVYPSLVSSQDYIYIFKTMMKQKKLEEANQKHDSILDIKGTKLTYPEFREAVLKMSCLGKLKLGGTTSSTLPEDIKIIEQQQKARVKQALSGAATSGVLKKPKDEMDDSNINDDLIGVFEKEFDVTEMTQYTVENMFKHLGLKADQKLVIQAQNSQLASPNKQKQGKSYGNLGSKQPSISENPFGGAMQSPIGSQNPVRQSLGGPLQTQNSGQQPPIQTQQTPNNNNTHNEIK